MKTTRFLLLVCLGTIFVQNYLNRGHQPPCQRGRSRYKSSCLVGFIYALTASTFAFGKERDSA